MSSLLEKIPVTVFIVTKNVEETLAACLQSVKNFSEVIVVDSLSQDKTVQLATRWGAHVISFEWDGCYPKKRQWTLENITPSHKWCLFLDADERMTPDLEQELRTIALNPIERHQAYFIDGQPIWCGRPLSNGRWHRKVVFFRAGALLFSDFGDLSAPDMGEIEGHYQPSVDGTVGSIQAPLLHDCAHNSLDWFDKHERYANWHAWVLAKNKNVAETEKGLRRLSKVLLYNVPLKHWLVFADSYLFKAGFLDGKTGLSYAKARAWYYKKIEEKLAEANKSV